MGAETGIKIRCLFSHFVWRLWCIMRRMSRLFVGVHCFAMTQLRRAEWRLKYHNTYMWLTLSSLSMSNVSGSSTNPLTRPLSPCFLQASDLTDVEREHNKNHNHDTIWHPIREYTNTIKYKYQRKQLDCELTFVSLASLTNPQLWAVL